MSIIICNQNIPLPFVILRFCASFSQDANDAFNTSANFLFVPGVKGGMPTGISAKKPKKK